MQNNNLCTLIMAGGRGTRFWPKSTEEKPKQFLNLLGEKTMLQLTVERSLEITPIERIFIVTGENYKNIVKEQLPNLPEKNIIIEPTGRNTAPCILLATLYIKQIYENTNIVVLPSDHMIKDVKSFTTVIKKANNYIRNENENSIVTIGITPTRPETGYGYIKYGEKRYKEIVKVESFVEKPNIEKAKQYLKEGKYLWNAGMFIFNVNYMLKELQTNYKHSYDILSKLPQITDNNYETELKKKYKECEAISIDYAIMEKSKNIYVIPSELGWDDIGTWKCLERYIEQDNNGNVAIGNTYTEDAKNNIIYAENKKIILLGVEDLFCIDSNGVLIIGKKDKLEEAHNYKNIV